MTVDNALLALGQATGTTDPMYRQRVRDLSEQRLARELRTLTGMHLTISKNITLGPGGGGTEVAFNGTAAPTRVPSR